MNMEKLKSMKKIIKLVVNESSGFCISGYGIDLIDKE